MYSSPATSVGEHTLAGKKYPMEMHIVHNSTEGKLAVIGMFFEVGKENAFLQQVLPNYLHYFQRFLYPQIVL